VKRGSTPLSRSERSEESKTSFIPLKVKNKLFFATLGFFILTRLINLTLLPIFNDEAIYIDWGQKMIGTGNLFFSLFDGKQPLLMWIFGIFANIFNDPLFGARLVSVIFGVFTFIGIYKITLKLSSEKAALLAVIIYSLSPLFLFFDRQALMESAVASTGVWSLFYLLNFLEKSDYKHSFWLGLIWGIGLWIKSSFLIFVLSSILIILIEKRKSLAKIIWNLLISFTTVLIILLPLIVQKDFGLFLQSGSRYSLSLAEIFGLPFSIWWKNFLSLIDVTFWQCLSILSIPLLLLSVKHFNKQKVLFLFFYISIFLYIFLTQAGSSRYLVAFLPEGIIIASIAVVELKNIYKWLILFPVFTYFLYFDFLLLFNPIAYFNNLSKVSLFSQKDNYLGTFTSGYDVTGAINYITGEVKGSLTVVGVRPDAGNPEDSTFVYLSKYGNIKTIYLSAAILGNYGANYIVSPYPIYFVARNGQLAGLDNLLIKEAEFIKPNQIDSVVVYKLRTKMP
jgi:4-amino-4-deoxy-L-arabinose transferase-like glycosyltransferase